MYHILINDCTPTDILIYTRYMIHIEHMSHVHVQVYPITSIVVLHNYIIPAYSRAYIYIRRYNIVRDVYTIHYHILYHIVQQVHRVHRVLGLVHHQHELHSLLLLYQQQDIVYQHQYSPLLAQICRRVPLHQVYLYVVLVAAHGHRVVVDALQVHLEHHVVVIRARLVHPVLAPPVLQDVIHSLVIRNDLHDLPYVLSVHRVYQYVPVNRFPQLINVLDAVAVKIELAVRCFVYQTEQLAHLLR